MRTGLTVAAVILSAFTAAALSQSTPDQPTHQAEFSAEVDVFSDHVDFGGFSAIEMRSATEFLALSDRATLWTGRITRDAAGKILSVSFSDKPSYSLKPITRAPRGRTPFDSEGMAILPNGRVAISFESHVRVATYALPEGAPKRTLTAKARKSFPMPELAEHAPKNGGPEALAITTGGILTLIPEDYTRGGKIPVYQFHNQDWQLTAQLPMAANYLPVAADFGPDGRLYLLERDFAVIGFRTRLRSFDLDLLAPHDERVHIDTGITRHDNVEGLSVWRDDAGTLRATMISDDNFNPLQSTQLLEYIIH